MAEALQLKVKCHACGNIIEGTARYGSGHYSPQGVDFEFTAVAKLRDPATGKTRVKGEITAVCPQCGVRNKWQL